MSADIVTRLSEALSKFADERKPDTDRPRCIHRVVIDIDPIDPLDWLRVQSLSGRFYWQDRDDKMRIAAVGEADVVTATRSDDLDELFRLIADRLHRSDPDVKYYGGVRFDPARPKSSRDTGWERFEVARFVLPRFELTSDQDKCRLACHVVEDANGLRIDDALASARELNFVAPSKPSDLPHLIGRSDRPDRAQWNNLIEHMLASFAAGECAKLVLARRTALEFGDVVDPWHLLKRLRDHNSACFVFGFQPDQAATFVGATPERLYRRDGHKIRTEAIAGTRPVSGDSAANDQFASELLESTKDRDEHELVVEGVTSALDRVCERYSIVESRGLLRLRTLQHLITRIEGELRRNVDDCQLLSELHPTPAVGGWPRERAVAQLRAREPFDRAWYSGPVGWIGAESAEFAVGIRSALVHDRFVDLFAGAGIVPGSDPDLEWIEVENKIIPFLVLLYGGRL
jgi:menaquinone-specific isochorismate synthase